jgi:hypothetical protein
VRDAWAHNERDDGSRRIDANAIRRAPFDPSGAFEFSEGLSEKVNAFIPSMAPMSSGSRIKNDSGRRSARPRG